MFIMFPIIKIENYMVPGQKQATINFIIINVKTDLHVYHVFSLLFPVSKITKLCQYTVDT